MLVNEISLGEDIAMTTDVIFDLADYLQNDSIFRNMPKRHIQTLADAEHITQTRQGECLFKQGDYTTKFYIVKSGYISVEIPAIYGPSLVMQKLDDDTVLGWSWLTPPYKWVFEANTELDVQVIEFEGKSLLKACDTDSELRYPLLKRFAALMSERLHETGEKMMNTWSAPGFA